MTEIEKSKKKLAAIGIDGEMLVAEIVQEAAKQIIPAIPSPEAAPVPQVDLDELAAKLRELMPEGGGAEVDVLALQAALEKKVDEKIDSMLGQIKDRLDVIKKEMRDGLDAAVDAKLMQYKADVAKAVREGMGSNGDGQGGGQSVVANPNDRWGMALQVFDRFLDRQDPLANIENLSNIYARLGNIFGGGPDPTTLYRGNQQAFIEGIKIGARAKGGAAAAPPLSSSPPAGHSIRRAGQSSRIDRRIQEL